ncbi:ABC transporter permease [Leucobacter luti]|uniref:Peptide/nickel transport system permease protein n=1 Tax=Leucobacter luti TaxID=340320 RepID=A0A4Q7U4W6_9MICO|nr:ABC transporter permease [Leucobacter luti]MBL3700657.1 ABC transporter permease [Leucobacter luti]RZT68503.1 peptide/nickel transport system permease protein [Leucobacter luti]
MRSDVAAGPRPGGRLARTVALRIAGVLVILLVISFLTFTLLYLAPGDLVKNLLGNRPSTPEAIAAVRAQYHLDDPFFVRYVDWLLAALRGDFGVSIRLQQPVTTVIASRMGVTSLLIGLSFVFAVITAIPLGILSAAKAGTRVDRVASATALFGLSAPSFALAILAITVFAIMIPVFPAYGAGDGFFDQLWHLVLPAAVLAAGIGAILMRMTRAAVLRELESDAITFARARGIAESRVRRIALRAALIPIVTSAGLILTFVIGGTIIVETVFALPGIGQLLEEAVMFKDLPVVQAITLLVAAAIALITILVDLSYVLLDPRIRARELSA